MVVLHACSIPPCLPTEKALRYPTRTLISCLVTLVSLLVVNELNAAEPMAAMGIMVGEVTETTALAQVRLTKADKLVKQDVPSAKGFVEFSLSEASSEEGSAVQLKIIEAPAARDGIARATFLNLKPGMRYRCKTRIGASTLNFREGPTAEFTTLQGAATQKPVSFAVVTGMNYAKFYGEENTAESSAVADSNSSLGYPALASILKLRPDFFIGTGDNVYYDRPHKNRAKTVPQLRQKWHEQFVQPRFVDLFASVPTYWMIDDHDYRVDDCDNSGDYLPWPDVGRRMMLEQLPVAPTGDFDAKTYRTHRVNRDLQIWLPENRMYRSPNADPDWPPKSIWGAEQKAWLKRTLKQSDATFKLLVSPTPMVGPDDLRKQDNHTNIGGFQGERSEFFDWLQHEGIDKQNFYIVCGDRHWQYHSIHPSGIEEFSCGALIDANSRLGRKPGDSKSTDPDGEISQSYCQSEPSGGFLMIDVSPADGDLASQLKFVFYDELGEVLHRVSKPAVSD